MAPMLSEQEPPKGMYKFVREGDKIAWGEMDEQHAQIARDNHIGVDTGKKEGPNQVIIDDAGDVRRSVRGYFVGGVSMSCTYREKDYKKPKKLTVEIWKRFTSEQVQEQ